MFSIESGNIFVTANTNFSPQIKRKIGPREKFWMPENEQLFNVREIYSGLSEVLTQVRTWQNFSGANGLILEKINSLNVTDYQVFEIHRVNKNDAPAALGWIDRRDGTVGIITCGDSVTRGYPDHALPLLKGMSEMASIDPQLAPDLETNLEILTSQIKRLTE